MIPIYIVGYMGAGKSTLGRRLATKLGLHFLDTDIFIENRFRQRISDMFAQIGEDRFRQRERYVIEELSGMTDCVIATGGGLPCFNSNMDLLNDTGLSVYLSASNETLTYRLEQCKRTRPTVYDKTGAELAQHVSEAMAWRRPIYEQAQISVSIDHLRREADEDALADKLADLIRARLSCQKEEGD